MTYLKTFATTALIIGLAGTAVARPAPNTGTPAAVQQLLDCRKLGDSAQRLACYDRQAGVISQAIATRELVVIDKARANQAKRSLFGFSVPNFGGLFGGGEDDIKQIESTIASVSHNPEGGWLLKLADGSLWSQVDDAMLGLPPKRGDKVVVKRGLMGSFYLELGKQPGFKAKRVG
ncbi:MAG: hypothetical protein ACREBK_06220 [Sphingomicrobium sp.]